MPAVACDVIEMKVGSITVVSEDLTWFCLIIHPTDKGTLFSLSRFSFSSVLLLIIQKRHQEVEMVEKFPLKSINM